MDSITDAPLPPDGSGPTAKDLDAAPAPRLAIPAAAAARTGWDAVWWPRTRLLVDELPGLVAALADRFEGIMQVSYSLSFWDDTPPRVAAGDRILRLDGLRTLKAHTLTVTGSFRGSPARLLVVAPEADADMLARSTRLVAGHGEELTWLAGGGGGTGPGPGPTG